MRETWVGTVQNLVVTKENSATDWVVVRLSNSSSKAPDWYALELSHRTPTSMAIYNLLRDAMAAAVSVRIIVDRDNARTPDWQRATVIGVELPTLPAGSTKRFN